MLAAPAQIKAVIFDMDGVLLFSSDGHRLAYEQTLAPIGITDFSYAEVAGMRTDEAFKKIFSRINQPLSEVRLQRLVKEKRQRALAAFGDRAKLAPAGHGLINDLRQRNYRVALASSASPATVEFFLSRCGYREAFETILDGSSVKEAKPSPQIYLLAANRLAVEPAACLVVEDSQSGVAAAVAAGMRVMGVAGTEPIKRLAAAGAHQVVTDLAEISALLS
ncbi:MAG TPA: HAD family phosphatase [Candidatus Saccharimonadales bacterium]|nr:HAD family phosphatase [Candidatus Saccharimonadales bacterium]